MRQKASLLIVATGLCLSLGQMALAVDLSQKPIYNAPVMPPPPVYSWTGCYIGANIGGAFGHGSVTENITGAQVSANNSGFTGGGQIGCDYEFSNGFVIGARNMFNGMTNSKSKTFPVGAFGGGTAVANFNNNWFDTLTARLGYAVRPDILLYFQGGAAWADMNTNVTYNSTQFNSSGIRSAWTIGGGVEWMFAPHWSTFLEYNYMDFGSKNINVTGTGATIYPVALKGYEQTVLAGVNWRFW